MFDLITDKIKPYQCCELLNYKTELDKSSIKGDFSLGRAY